MAVAAVSLLDLAWSCFEVVRVVEGGGLGFGGVSTRFGGRNGRTIGVIGVVAVVFWFFF
jgi:hypothetical protein